MPVLPTECRLELRTRVEALHIVDKEDVACNQMYGVVSDLAHQTSQMAESGCGFLVLRHDAVVVNTQPKDGFILVVTSQQRHFLDEAAPCRNRLLDLVACGVFECNKVLRIFFLKADVEGTVLEKRRLHIWIHTLAQADENQPLRGFLEFITHVHVEIQRLPCSVGAFLPTPDRADIVEERVRVYLLCLVADHATSQQVGQPTSHRCRNVGFVAVAFFSGRKQGCQIFHAETAHAAQYYDPRQLQPIPRTYLCPCRNSRVSSKSRLQPWLIRPASMKIAQGEVCHLAAHFGEQWYLKDVWDTLPLRHQQCQIHCPSLHPPTHRWEFVWRHPNRSLCCKLFQLHSKHPYKLGQRLQGMVCQYQAP